MSELEPLVRFAEDRANRALIAWQRLRAQCDETKQKLRMLGQHGEHYGDQMRADLQQGSSGTSVQAHIGFIAQIEAVRFRQESEISNLEEACRRLWQELLEARREKRMYEILSERAQMRNAQAVYRRQQAEIDELLQRAVKSR
jgi:flagellar export protein FliJ